MEKVTIKVKVDEALTFNLDIPKEVSAEEFTALIDRAKINRKSRKGRKREVVS